MDRRPMSLRDLIREMKNRTSKREHFFIRCLAAFILGKASSEVTQDEIVAQFKSDWNNLIESDKQAMRVVHIYDEAAARASRIDADLEQLRKGQADAKQQSVLHTRLLQSKITDLESLNKCHLEKIGELEGSLNGIHQEIEKRAQDHKSVLDEKNKAINDAAEREACLRSDVEKTRVAAAKKSRELREIIQANAEEISGLLQNVSRLSNAKLDAEEKVVMLERQMKWAEEHVDQLHIQVKDLQEKKDGHEAQLSDMDSLALSLNDKINILEASKNSCEDQVESLTAAVADLECQMVRKDDKIISLEEQLSDLNVQTIIKDGKIDTLQALSDRASNRIQDLSSALKKCSDDVTQLQTQVSEKDSKIAFLEIDVGKLQSDVSLHNAIIDTKTSQLEAQEDRIAELLREHQEDIAVKDKEIAALKWEMNEKLSQKDESTQSEAAGLREEIASLTKVIELKASAISEITREKKDLCEYIHQLQSDLNSKDITIINLRGVTQEQTAYSQAQAARIRSLIDEITKDAGVSESQSREIARLDMKMAEKNREIETLEAKVDELDKAYDENEKKMKQDHRSLAQVNRGLNQVLGELHERNHVLRSEISSYIGKIQDKNSEITWLRKQLVKETGIEVEDGCEISFIETHSGHRPSLYSINATDTTDRKHEHLYLQDDSPDVALSTFAANFGYEATVSPVPENWTNFLGKDTEAGIANTIDVVPHKTADILEVAATGVDPMDKTMERSSPPPSLGQGLSTIMAQVGTSPEYKYLANPLGHDEQTKALYEADHFRVVQENLDVSFVSRAAADDIIQPLQENLDVPFLRAPADDTIHTAAETLMTEGTESAGKTSADVEVVGRDSEEDEWEMVSARSVESE